MRKFLLILLVLSAAGCTNLSEVAVRDEYKACSADLDCVLFNGKCNSCDCGTPVNRQHLEALQKQFSEVCSGYRGAVCDMYCPPRQLQCVSGICSAADTAEQDADVSTKKPVSEEIIDLCSVSDDCIVVPYRHCCGSTKRAINKLYLDDYNSHPDWQKFDDPDTCTLIGVCPYDSNITEAICTEEDGYMGCRLNYG